MLLPQEEIFILTIVTGVRAGFARYLLGVSNSMEKMRHGNQTAHLIQGVQSIEGLPDFLPVCLRALPQGLVPLRALPCPGAGGSPGIVLLR